MLEEKDIQAIAQLILASEERLRGEIGQVEERLRVEFHSKLETEIHASEERTRTGIQEEMRASEDRLRGEMGQVEDRLRTEFQSKLETEIRASEERLRTEFHSQMKEEIHASETRTHAYIESGVMKPIRLLAEGHAQILERLPEADELDSLRGRVRNLERIVTEQGREIDALKRA